MFDPTKAEKYRLAIEADKAKFMFTDSQKNKAISILKDYIGQPSFNTNDVQTQQRLLASACGQMIAEGIPDIKAVTYISNAHGRISASNGDVKSLDELLIPNQTKQTQFPKQGMLSGATA